MALGGWPRLGVQPCFGLAKRGDAYRTSRAAGKYLTPALCQVRSPAKWESRNVFKTRLCVLAAALALAMPITAAAEKFPVLDNKAGLLKSKCQPLSVLATIRSGGRIGLDPFEMNDHARSFFQSAELLAPRDTFGGDTFIVETTVLGGAYFTTLKFRRTVDIGGESYVFAIVWEDEVSGFHGGSPSHIMDVLSDRYNRFIEYYLDTNNADCASRRN